MSSSFQDPDFFRCRICRQRFVLFMPMDRLCNRCKTEAYN